MNKKILIRFDQRKRYPYDNYVTAKSVIGRGNPHLNVLKSHFLWLFCVCMAMLYGRPSRAVYDWPFR